MWSFIKVIFKGEGLFLIDWWKPVQSQRCWPSSHINLENHCKLDANILIYKIIYIIRHCLWLCALYLLLFCSSICSLLLSTERILGSTRDSNVSNIIGSTSFSRACSVFTYWHEYMKTHDMNIHASPYLVTEPHVCPQFTGRFDVG